LDWIGIGSGKDRKVMETEASADGDERIAGGNPVCVVSVDGIFAVTTSAFCR
jgi:hypothetical protein